MTAAVAVANTVSQLVLLRRALDNGSIAFDRQPGQMMQIEPRRDKYINRLFQLFDSARRRVPARAAVTFISMNSSFRSQPI